MCYTSSVLLGEIAAAHSIKGRLVVGMFEQVQDNYIQRTGHFWFRRYRSPYACDITADQFEVSGLDKVYLGPPVLPSLGARYIERTQMQTVMARNMEQAVMKDRLQLLRKIVELDDILT